MTKDFQESINELLILSGQDPIPDSAVNEVNEFDAFAENVQDFLNEVDEKDVGDIDDDDDDDDTDDDDKKDTKRKGEDAEDELEYTFDSGGKIKLLFHENYLYVYYRERRSPRIDIPPRLRYLREQLSDLLDNIFSFAEGVS